MADPKKTYISKKPLGEAVVTAKAPDWVSFQREFDIKDYVKREFENAKGPDKIKKINPKGFLNELIGRARKERTKYVAEKIAEKKPQGDMTRAQYLNTMTEQEEAILKSQAKYEPTIWDRAGHGVRTSIMPALGVPTKNIIQASDNFSEREKAQMSAEFDSSPVSYQVSSAMNMLAPLEIPGKVVQSATRENYSLSDAISGVRNEASLLENIATDPLNLAGTGLLGMVGRVGRGINFANDAATGARAVNRTFRPEILSQMDDAINRMPRNTSDGGIYSFQLEDAVNQIAQTPVERAVLLTHLEDQHGNIPNLYHQTRMLGLDDASRLMSDAAKLKQRMAADPNNLTDQELAAFARRVSRRHSFLNSNLVHDVLSQNFTQRLADQTLEAINASHRVTSTSSLGSTSQALPPSPTTYTGINRSGFSKDDLVGKIKEDPDDVFNRDFENSIFTPEGQLLPYLDMYGLDNDEKIRILEGLTNSKKEFMTSDEFIDLFNKDISKLNDIVRNKNVSGYDYEIFGLQKDRYTNYDGDLLFSSPKQKNIPETQSRWAVEFTPGKLTGEIKNIPSREYYSDFVPGLKMSNTIPGVFNREIFPQGTRVYEAINDYLKLLEIGRVKPGFNSQTKSSFNLWESAIKKGKGLGYYRNKGLIYGSLKSAAPWTIPIGTGILSQQEE